MTPEALLAFDREHLWHPYTSMTDPTPTRLVTGASGSRITLDGVGEVVDGMASWWSAIHGYRHPILDEAVRRQLDSMSHVMFGGLTHEPAVELARRLIDLAPAGLDRVFLADSGSVSVEVAMKMALQYQRGTGRPERTRFLTVRGGYHGDTFDCMSVCDPDGGMHAMWSGVLPEQVFGERPPPLGGDVDAWAAGFRALAAEHADRLAGLVVEPLLQGAGGMHPYPAECLAVFREVADEHGLVLVFDEIATGFGRTGTLFAAEAADVAPDVLCVGKALTGGYLSLAAALCTTEVARGLSASDSGVLMHGPTFMGNPLACAVASASLDLLTTGDWAADVRRINTGLQALHEIDAVDVRVLGAVGVVQLDHPVDVPEAAEAALAQGVWLRPFRDLIYTMPPYVCTDDDIAAICAGIAAAAEAG
ncbi:adenosylmethionine-8-amino-7-oxononanoate aminotransferase [Saccharopolyspora erythraea NRRL 2338]|uniref:Adenosylmethionine-8-amino-7-oxononanoate aminotransferase n=3 Tax=Saccharopolyspora erythraea TaxID=1836 RepID=A4FIS7_SACEN|nr:adenosylmethionine--8-amino-7-oxononanoate transaminase [Saccharopolyspora erythraea]PFG97626.1 adenosylmethionine-8-amino-7-oxononanoate aminotransferase [Saccharopolyspora erythraea NRRL 2338]QRK87784.1 adenosylmethionine--8-amino-7-oxononanoate transaminase [Saccharopolyspora erythraea]CAM03952.1 adenosylmethionine-8-amino-7-oxononanoate aminotransferase [Saccharopolyspora erythraea NRRL 2338]